MDGPRPLLPFDPLYFPSTPFQLTLTAVADTTPARVRQAVYDFGYGSGASDWLELMDRPDIDVIDITAPNAIHEEIAEAAAAVGNHIFCEKPVGISAEATARIGRPLCTPG